MNLDLTLNELDLLRVIVENVNRPVQFTGDGIDNYLAVKTKVGEACVAAQLSPNRLPAGWQPTLDGVNTTLDMGAGRQTFSRSYRHTSGLVVTAPCGPDGSPVRETAEALIAALLVADGFQPAPPAPAEG